MFIFHCHNNYSLCIAAAGRNTSSEQDILCETRCVQGVARWFPSQKPQISIGDTKEQKMKTWRNQIMFTHRSSGIAGNWTDFPRRTSIIRCCFYPAQLDSSCLSMDMLGGRRQGDDFPLSLHTLCKGLWKFLYFFSVLSFPKPAGKPITLKRPQRKKSVPWAVSLAQTHRALTRLMSDPWVMDTARFGCLVGPQFCNSHWDFLQPQIVTPGRTEKTYSRLTSIALYHVWPTPEQPPCSPRPVCVTSIIIWLYDAATAERTVLRTWGKHIQLTSGEHNKQQKICPSFCLLLKHLISVGNFFSQ